MKTTRPRESTLCALGLCLLCTNPECQHKCHEVLNQGGAS